MKIRIDFVTNSSSSSFVSLHITSVKLAKIIATTEIDDLKILENGKTVNYQSEELDAGQPPKSAKDIVDKLVELVSELGELNNEDYGLENTLRDNEKSILGDIEAVEWQHEVEAWGEAYGYEGIEMDIGRLMTAEGLSMGPESVKISQGFHFTKETGEEYKKKYTYVPAGEIVEKTVELDADDTCEVKGMNADFGWSCYTQISVNEGEDYEDESMSFPDEPSIMPYDLERLPNNFIDVLKATDSTRRLMDALKPLFVPGCAEWGFLTEWFVEVEDISALKNIKMQSVKCDDFGRGQEITLKYSFKTKKGSINRKTVKAYM